MSKYNTFLTVFIMSFIASVTFMIIYIKEIFSVMLKAREYTQSDPFNFFNTIFTPAFIIALVIMLVTSLICRIIGIIYVARNKNVTDGEKALWIVGFILMNFVTSIVFLILAKGRKYAD